MKLLRLAGLLGLLATAAAACADRDDFARASPSLRGPHGSESAADPARALQDYALQCRGCHGAEGAGVAGRVPPLRGVGALLETPEGRARLLAVPGVRQASLSDERLAELLGWVATVFAPPGASPAEARLSAEEVARHRGTLR